MTQVKCCAICKKDGISSLKINGHICENCYVCTKKLWIIEYFWIDAKEKMPEKDGRYLVVENHPYQWIGVSALRNGKFDFPISYWTELPSPPK